MQPAKPDEWKTYRDLRLRALLDSPDAFGSTYEAEATSGKDRVLFAFNRNDACGLIWCKLSNDQPAVADLFQMWVDPASRGMGAGRALLEAAVSWAARVGMKRVGLGVTVADTPAMRLYTACGFRPDGALEPLREHSHLMVQPMSLALGPAGSTD
ncbi:GNAT family N-acetyltransferase [Variovorax boronicumulans]|uniref:GNAT family N-acetyltransferase n=1 Tax=Variovorax boronicumulans TaxID=436515 RepID=UPI0036F1BB68